MSIHTKIVAKDGGINDSELKEGIRTAIEKTGKKLNRILILPPDHTRLNSYAGRMTEMIWEMYHDFCKIDIMPALGTHAPMTEQQLRMMFGNQIPLDAFLVHNWRNDTISLGTISTEKIESLSCGKLHFDVKVQVNKILFENNYDLILSVGQIVPHEVVGLSNYTKNIMVGIGGADIINKSHFLGAVSNMESIMGRADSPVRELYNYAAETYLSGLPIVYMETVMVRDEQDSGKMLIKGFFAGTGNDLYQEAANLSIQENIILLDKPLHKVIVYLDPKEFGSTWLGNKAIYRTRMAIADDGELIVLAPGLHQFGEDQTNDELIRKYGYHGTPKTIHAVEQNEDLQHNLGAAAHLIHGSSEGRFRIIYCPGDKISREEIESVGFEYGNLQAIMEKYDVEHLKDGFNQFNGDTIFFISNPALGLWSLKSNFTKN